MHATNRSVYIVAIRRLTGDTKFYKGELVDSDAHRIENLGEECKRDGYLAEFSMFRVGEMRISRAFALTEAIAQCREFAVLPNAVADKMNDCFSAKDPISAELMSSPDGEQPPRWKVNFGDGSFETMTDEQFGEFARAWNAVERKLFEENQRDPVANG